MKEHHPHLLTGIKHDIGVFGVAGRIPPLVYPILQTTHDNSYMVNYHDRIQVRLAYWTVFKQVEIATPPYILSACKREPGHKVPRTCHPGLRARRSSAGHRCAAR